MNEFISLDKIIIVKNKNNNGLCSLFFNAFTINNIFIDLTDGVNPVRIPNYEGKNIIEGKFIDECIKIVLTYFQDILGDQSPGIYEFNKEVKFKAKKGSEI